MSKPVTRLMPGPPQELALQGLYLDPGLHPGRPDDRPFVYSNFVTSLDGRIAVSVDGHTTRQVPPAIANERDWRLYQELAGQAQILLTSGRFYRQSARGEAQARLPVGEEDRFADIRAWRTTQGMKPQPDVGILSGSLDIPLTSLEPYRSRTIHIFTGSDCDHGRRAELEQAGINIVTAGDGRHADGRRIIDFLAQAGYHSIYAIAGPAVLHTLLSAGVIDRLYLTIACTVLGGTDFSTLAEGDLLVPPAGMQATGLYHDPHAPAGGQLFGMFEPG